jgi:hypothetical protein
MAVIVDDDTIGDDTLQEAEAYFASQRGWTWRRFLLLMVALLIIAMILVYIVLPIVQFYTTPLPSRPMMPPINL